VRKKRPDPDLLKILFFLLEAGEKEILEKLPTFASSSARKGKEKRKKGSGLLGTKRGMRRCCPYLLTALPAKKEKKKGGGED